MKVTLWVLLTATGDVLPSPYGRCRNHCSTAPSRRMLKSPTTFKETKTSPAFSLRSRLMGLVIFVPVEVLVFDQHPT